MVAHRAGDARGWNQHLQRAQAAGWFCRSDRIGGASIPVKQAEVVAHGIAPRGTRTQTTLLALLPTRSRLTAQPTAAVDRPASLAVTSLRGSVDLPATTRDAAPLVRREPVVLPAAAGTDGARIWAPAARPHVDEARPAGPLSSARQDDQSIRVHIEGDADQLHLWLGIDGLPAEIGARAAALAVELRSDCERAGVRLASIVCNGVRLPLSTRKDS
jgi:hypothetical protein